MAAGLLVPLLAHQTRSEARKSSGMASSRAAACSWDRRMCSLLHASTARFRLFFTDTYGNHWSQDAARGLRSEELPPRVC